MAEIGRPPILRRGHQLLEVMLERLDVELFELSAVVKAVAERVRKRRVVVQHGKVELVGPPVPVCSRPMSFRLGARDYRVLALAHASVLSPRITNNAD